MNRTFTQTLQFLLSSLALLLLAVACTGDSGSSGNLRFQDKSGVRSNKVLTAAVGRDAEYNIVSTAIQPKNLDVEEATSSDDAVFTVENISGSRVVVKGHKEGTAKLTVRTKNNKEDSIDLTFAAPETTYFDVHDVNDDKRFVRLLDVQGKYNVAPQGELELKSYRIVDKDGARLSGKQVKEFENGTDGSLRVDEGSIVGGDAGDSVQVSNAYGSNLNVRTVDDLAIAKLYGYVHEMSFGDLDLAIMQMQKGTSFELLEGGNLFQVYAEDSGGYTYLTDDVLDAKITLSGDAGINLLYIGRDGSKDYCIDHVEDGDDEYCVEWSGLPDVAFMLTRDAEKSGTATVKVTAGGVSQDFTIKF